MAALPTYEPSCAICSGPGEPHCTHEKERLILAMDQATQRWTGLERIRKWVVKSATWAILNSFDQIRRTREEQYKTKLAMIPMYGLYAHHYPNPPPIGAHEWHVLHTTITQAHAAYRAILDEDWRRSCLRYPEIIDHYYSLVEISFPSADDDHASHDPRMGPPGGPGSDGRRIRHRRSSGSLERAAHKDRRRREKRRPSRGRATPEFMYAASPPSPPPPLAPMPGHYRR